MHSNPEDLTALERQLTACRPSATGLDADAMLFAAGRATAERRGSRIVWPAIACGFALLSLALGTGLMSERSERLALADRLARMSPAFAEVPTPAVTTPSQPLPADSYFAIRRSFENSDGFLAQASRRTAPPLPMPSGTPILHGWPTTDADLKP
jgi:hypothetical protein